MLIVGLKYFPFLLTFAYPHRLYYKSSSVLCHPEYCQIFLILLGESHPVCSPN